MDQAREQTLLLQDIQQRLERLENQHRERAIETIDLGQFAIALRRSRIGVFPDEYCAGNIWDVLLELYDAKRSGEKLRLSEIATNAKIAEKLTLRYVNLLSADGLLHYEEDAEGQGEPFILLTEKAMVQIEQLFQHTRMRALGGTGPSAVAEKDAGITIDGAVETV